MDIEIIARSDSSEASDNLIFEDKESIYLGRKRKNIDRERDEKNDDYIPSLSVIPTWGIRRHLGKSFHYEAGIGAGYSFLFPEQNHDDHGEFSFNLHLRIGYDF